MTRPLDIGLINNASSQAFDWVTRQFRTLLGRAAAGQEIRLHVASLPGIARRRGDMSGVDTVERLLARQPLDAAIVTGAEPTRDDLADEPYWGKLTDFLDLADLSGLPLVLSCLAAHAAVQHATGLRRTRLSRKCFGVFGQQAVAEHPLLRGVPARFDMPHSRWNALRADELSAAGYRILTRSEQSGIDMFVCDATPHVFFQGHPEYAADTLVREYDRDVGRFLRGETCCRPALPAQAGSANGWTQAATAIFGNWLDHLGRDSTHDAAPAPRALDHAAASG